MSARTAPLHKPDELDFIGCDDQTGIVVFQTTGGHDAARVNTTALDTTTDASLCDCKGAERGRRCWHADHVAAAWLRTGVMLDARWLTDAEPIAYGKKLGAMCRSYRARTGHVLPMDAASLIAARSEWRRRAALAPAPVAADLAVAA